MSVETANGNSAPLLAAAVATNRLVPLGVVFKTAYGLGQFVDSTSGTLLNVFLFFYLTTVCGLSGSLTGIALFVALAIDAVADPVVGSLSDNLSTRWGRRIPPMAISLVPIAVALGLIFSVPPIAPGAALFLYVLGLLTLLRISLSGFIIPYFGLGAELSDDYDERSSIVAFRAIFAMFATLIAYVLGFQVFLGGPHGLLDRASYVPLGWTCSAILLVTGAVATCVSLKALPRMHHTVPSEHHILRRLAGEMTEVFRNPSFRYLFVGVLVFFVGQGVWQTLGLHTGRYFWNFDTHAIQMVGISTVGGLALGLPIAFLVIGRIEKRTMVLSGVFAVCLAEMLPILAQIFGMFPQPVHFPVLIAAAILSGMLATLVAIAFQSSMADAADEHEAKFGTRREGVYFAGLSFAGKAATGLGSLISGFLLDLIAFPSAQIASGKHVVVTPDVVRDLGLASGPAAVGITLIAMVILSRYRLDRAAHTEIRRQLAKGNAL